MNEFLIAIHREIAKGCPIISYGAIVEVRMAIPVA